MEGIIRNPTANEVEGESGFTPLATKRGIVRSKEQNIHIKLKNYESEANKKGLPFAWKAAYDEIIDNEEQKKILLKRQGHLSGYKEKKIDFTKFSNLKNFKLIKEEEVADDNLTKIYRMPIFFNTRTYQYIGYSNKYIVQETKESALNRAAKTYDLGRTPLENKTNKGNR